VNNWRAAAWLVGLGVLIGLFVGGVIWLAGAPPRGEPVRLLPPPTALPVTVHVTGAVARPGLVILPTGSCLADALQAAGGVLPEGDDQALNLAAPLEDGQQVFVPTRPSTTTVPDVRAGEIPLVLSPAKPQAPININRASQEELESLPGIGPVLAQAILAYRSEHGPFKSIEAIQDVSGIGPRKFAEIEALITVGP